VFDPRYSQLLHAHVPSFSLLLDFMFRGMSTTYRRTFGPLAAPDIVRKLFHPDQKVGRSIYAEAITHIRKLGGPLGPVPVQSQTEQPLPTHQMHQKLSVRPTDEVDADGNLPDADALRWEDLLAAGGSTITARRGTVNAHEELVKDELQIAVVESLRGK
jgi:hypothetical protein